MHVFKVWASSSSLRLPLYQISFLFMASVAELAHGEKTRTQSITQSLINPAYLMPWEPKLSLRNIYIVHKQQ